MRPQLSGRGATRVALLGEALSVDEVDHGRPFMGKAGFRLTRLLEWAGVDRDSVSIFSTVWCYPPDHKLAGEPYEAAVVAHCRAAHWDALLAGHDVVVPLGNVPTTALLGRGEGILKRRGYVYAPAGASYRVIPTVHPAFIQRGQAKWSAAFINDIQRAVEVASSGVPVMFDDFTLDPTPAVAWEWICAYRAALERDPTIRLSFDIETPGKGDDEDEVDTDDDPTFVIHRIGFAYGRRLALSIPFAPEYFAVIRTALESVGEKIVWNAGFDVPRLRAAGFAINGTVHDGMVMWHVLHSDLPKSLGFVATFAVPWQPAWKHLSHARPAFYNATDAAVEWEAVEWIEAELRRVGLWEVYDRDVVRLEPLLNAMSVAGMPIDAEVRADRAARLTERVNRLRSEMEALVPRSCRVVEPAGGFVRAPTDVSGLVTITVDAPVKRCDRCGAVNPLKSHFRTFKRPTASRPQNPCAGAGVVERVEAVERFARLAEWKPSRTALLRYQHALGRIVPMKWDKVAKAKKPTMDEKAMKMLMGKYPTDPLYALVLDYREVEKLGGTYIGFAVESADERRPRE